jgi:hypothetical protein
MWRGFAFDPGARCVSENLMLWSGEWVRGLRTHGGRDLAVRRRALKRDGSSLEGC